MCNPIAPPNTLKKNKNSTPIANLTVVCPIKRIGFTGAPMSNNITIKVIKMMMTIVELVNFFNPFFASNIKYERTLKKRTVLLN